jgi:hypothetical protein
LIQNDVIGIVERKTEGVWAYQSVQWLVTVLLLPPYKARLAAMFVVLFTNADNSDIKR